LTSTQWNVADLVRDDALDWKFLRLRLGTLEHLHQRALRVLEGHHVGDRRLRVLQPARLHAMRVRLLLEGVEVVVRADLEAEPHALRSAALAQHHRMMVEGRGEVGRVLFLGDKIESEDVGVVLDLPVEVGRLIGRVSDLLHADHLAGVFLNHCFTFSAGN
jgi:hypothetical protein